MADENGLSSVLDMVEKEENAKTPKNGKEVTAESTCNDENDKSECGDKKNKESFDVLKTIASHDEQNESFNVTTTTCDLEKKETETPSVIETSKSEDKQHETSSIMDTSESDKGQSEISNEIETTEGSVDKKNETNSVVERSETEDKLIDNADVKTSESEGKCEKAGNETSEHFDKTSEVVDNSESGEGCNETSVDNNETSEKGDTSLREVDKEETSRENCEVTTVIVNEDIEEDHVETIVMEVDVVISDHYESDNDNEGVVLTPSKQKERVEEKDGDSNNKKGTMNNSPYEPVIAAYEKKFGSMDDKKSDTCEQLVENAIIKPKPNVLTEIVLIDSDDEKDEKLPVKPIVCDNSQKIAVASSVISKPPPAVKAAIIAKPPPLVVTKAPPLASTKLPAVTNLPVRLPNKPDFQIVSVDDDTSLNKNDPMNVFQCSDEEREFRKDYFKDPSSNVLKQRLHCTICDVHIGSCPQNSKNMVCHRFLKVLICRKCANFYGQGEFPQDDGSDEFCRWCGEGGEVFCCNTCCNVFCQACILRNFGMPEVKRVDKIDNWDCYVCDTRPLWTLRAIAFALFTYVRRIKMVAYRNGMYQTINNANAKVSKSDLMALETDLSTCCPKEVKAAAAAASSSMMEANKMESILKQNAGKPKETKTVNQVNSNQLKILNNQVNRNIAQTSKAKDNQYISVNKQIQNPYPQIRTAVPMTRPNAELKHSQRVPQVSPQWQHPSPQQVIPRTYQITQPPGLTPFPQSTLRSALINDQTNYVTSPQQVPASFGPQKTILMLSSPTGSSIPMTVQQSKSKPVVWFNGVISSFMDTLKNIENRLVFIRNSSVNLISSNEVSFLVNQLHNVLKVSASKMQEVDCDLLKSYKEFIDKGELSVNDFDDIVREFPEFFKHNETEEPPKVVEPDDCYPTEDFNPLALVEVVDDQQLQSSVSERTVDSVVKTALSAAGVVGPSTITVKKELVENYSEVAKENTSESGKKNGKTSGIKRKADPREIDENVKNKVQLLDTSSIKKEKDDVDYEARIKMCTVKLTDVSKLTKCKDS